MAEDDFLATKSGSQFRGSRYPGFSSGTVSPTTGLGTSSTTGAAGSSSGLSGGGNNTSLAAQAFDIPEYTAPSMGAMAKDLGGMAAGGATQWAATEVGKGAGTAIASGATFGEGMKAGVQGLGDTVTGWFASEGTKHVGTEAGKAALQEGGKAVVQEGTSLGAQSLASEGASQAAGEAWSQTSNAATSGSTLGGAAGAGIGRAVVGLATGEKPESALRAGAGTGAGYYAGTVLGTAIGGPVGGAVGGFIGSTIGSIFCFGAGTPVLMADNTTKAVEDLDLGDVTLLGGEVVACGRAFAEEVFVYKGVLVARGHAVFEDGRWLRVQDSRFAVPVAGLERQTVFPVATADRLLVTPWFIAADIEEVDNTSGAYSDEDRIDLLNGDVERNSMLCDMEKELPGNVRAAA